jgi:hypothetical protein
MEFIIQKKIMKNIFLLLVLVLLFTFNSFAQNDNTFWMGLLSSTEYNGQALANIHDKLYLVDGGDWTELSSTDFHNLIDLKSDKNDVIWAVTRNNIQISHNKGQNWEFLSIPVTSITSVKFFGDVILLDSWGNLYAQHMDSLDGEWAQIHDSGLEDFIVTSDSTI